MDDLRDSIAIIGMSGRFPGANNLAEFWANLVNGVESITRLEEEKLRAAGVPEAIFKKDNYVKAKPMLERPEWFDAAFFGYAPAEAAQIDPQQRLFLETAWEALEQAGYDSEKYPGWISVYAATHLPTYLFTNLQVDETKLGGAEGLQLLVSNDKDYLATRVAYKLNCTGAAIDVQTACSSSLVAVHLACQNLLNYQSDLALAGGVAVSFPHYTGYENHQGSITSPDGHCRPFDAAAAGTVFGEAVGVVVLKRYEDALKDRDTIHAVIRGSAVNNDGAQKAGFTAPASAGQSMAISMALAAADISAESIGYLETHGTGTALGDPIEFRALGEVFGRESNLQHYCALGSVKANLGHASTAAGIVSLIKTILILKNRYLPPQLYCEQLNPHLKLEGSPFFIPTQGLAWQSETPRRAGVSSFGVGGTNAHVILEEAPLANYSKNQSQAWELVPLAARSEAALEQMKHNLANYLTENPELSLTDLAYTLQQGRREFSVRQALVAKNLAELREALLKPQRTRVKKASLTPRAVWLFPGQGAQYPQMGRELYETYEVFRELVDQAAIFLKPLLGLDLRKVIYPAADELEQARLLLQETRLTQPALFVTEYATARLMQAWGFTPSVMLGHSLGEYVAATLAGVFTFTDALWVITKRAELMQRITNGKMMTVFASQTVISAVLVELKQPPEFAAVNGEELCTLTGTEAELEECQAALLSQGIKFKVLATSGAFHSKLIEPLMAELEEIIAAVPRQTPTISYLSNYTGNWIMPTEAVDPHYYALQMRNTVQMYQGIQRIQHTGTDYCWLEVGPGTGLTTMVKSALGAEVFTSNLLPKVEALASNASFLNTLGDLWSVGYKIPWEKMHHSNQGHRIPLPTYPFERIRCWYEPEVRKTELTTEKPTETELVSVPVWRNRMLTQAKRSSEFKQSCLVFEDALGLTSQLEEYLSSFESVIRVRIGKNFSKLAEDLFTIRTDSQEDLEQLFDLLKEQAKLPEVIIFLWLYSDLTIIDETKAAQVLDEGLYTLFALGKVIATSKHFSNIDLLVVASQLAAVAGENLIIPEKSCLTGFCFSLAAEIPDLKVKLIDFPVLRRENSDRALLTVLQRELTVISGESLVLLRKTGRFVRDFEAFSVAEVQPSLRLGGVYLITGGLSGIGLELAKDLARKYQAKLLLLSRQAFPARQEWKSYAQRADARLEWVELIETFNELERLGASIQVFQVDLTEKDVLREVIVAVKDTYGKLDGVFHGAGVAGEGLLFTKSRAQIEKVLNPKINGTREVLSLAEATEAEFLLLYSSTFSFTGGVGQTDYAAANAFLNATAAALQNISKVRVLTVSWDAWAGSGMAVRTGLTSGKPLLAGKYVPNQQPQSSLIDSVTRVTPDLIYFQKSFLMAHEWLLAEHRAGVKAIIPGTAWIAMIYQAANYLDVANLWEISELELLAPAELIDGLALAVTLELRVQEEFYQLRIFSQSETGLKLYATGFLKRALKNSLVAEKFLELNSPLETVTPDPLFTAVNQSGLIQWGPRWENLQQFWQNNRSLKALIALHDDFLADQTAYPLHPALLDTGLAIAVLWNQGEAMLPTRYQSIILAHVLPPKFYAVAEIDQASQPGRMIQAELKLYDEFGNNCGIIKGFTLKRAAERVRARQTLEKVISLEMGLALTSRFTGLEGVAEVVVSRRSRNELLNMIQAEALLEQHQSEVALTQQSEKPKSVMEEMSLIWQELLGVTEIQPEDNFFDLGGHSLMAIRVLARIRAVFGLELQTEEVFKISTLESLVSRIAELLAVKQSETESKQEFLELQQIKPDQSGRTVFPLSSSQRRIFFFHELEGDNTAYTLPSIMELHGELNQTALQGAFDLLVKRHQILRTTFHNQTELFQKVHPVEHFPLTFEDLSQAVNPAELAWEKAINLAKQPFNLEILPLMRIHVMKLATRKSSLVLLAHHIISDYWSAGILMKELTTIYNALIKQTEPKLTELPIQYGDYAVWQEEYFQTPQFEMDFDYWKKQLKDAPQLLQLPLDLPRPANESHQGGTVELLLPAALINEIQQLCRNHGATLFMGLNAAWQVLLSRYSGQKEIMIGSPVSGRKLYEFENLIGMFVNNLVLRGNLEGNPSFLELLERNRIVVSEAFNHQDLPFEKIVEAANVPRDLSYSPVFQVVFILQNVPEVLPEFDNLHIQSKFVPQETAKHDLTLECYPIHTGEIKTRLEYNNSIFYRETAVRLLENYQQILQAIVVNPSQKIEKLSLINPEEARLLLKDFNQTEQAVNQELLTHQLIHQTAQAHPEAIACEFAGEQMSYAKFDAYSSQLAHYLRELGVGPEVIVGVSLARSLKLPAVFQAVLKAGGAYVPLDPLLPSARIEYILNDAQAAMILTDTEGAASLSGFSGRLINLGAAEHQKSISAMPSTLPLSGVRPENLAYIIYTSGSTGNPKGVAIEHRNLLNLILSMRQQPGLTREDTLLALTTISFDMSIPEFHLPLICGAKILLGSKEDSLDAQLLEQLIAEGVTIMQGTPATWRMLLANGWHGKADLKILCGGEAMTQELARELIPRCQSLWNMYGPTETTVWSSLAQITKAEQITIGKPINNTCLVVLDEHEQLVPLGVTGTLWIGGAGVARGYLNRPELTKEKFVTLRLADDFRERLYNTGDLARVLPDGSLECLGRNDSQVKLRGFRIELGEIEACLEKLVGIWQVAVVLAKDALNEEQLVAYYSEAGTQKLDTTIIRNYLRELLPEYMIPSYFYRLTELPLSVNGKIDRKALKKLELTMQTTEAAGTAPSSAMERTLAKLWEEFFRRPIYIENHFFELGGHSLMAMQVLNKLRQTLKTQIPLKLIYQQPVLKDLASELELIAQNDMLKVSQEIAVTAETGKQPLLMQQRWFLAEAPRRRQLSRWNTNLLLRHRIDLDFELLRQAVLRVINHHPALRAKIYQVEPGSWVQEIEPTVLESPTLQIDLTSLPRAERSQALTEACDQLQNNFQLETGKLFQVVAYRLAADDYRLWINAHHLITDGISLFILLEEILDVYEALAAGRRPELLPEQTSGATWTRELEQEVKTKLLPAERDYWLNLPWEQIDYLPADYPETAHLVTVQSIRVLEASLGEGLTKQLNELAQTTGIELLNIIISALFHAVASWTGNQYQDLMVLDSGRNLLFEREELDLSRTVGWLVSERLLILKRADSSVVKEILAEINQQLEAIPNGGHGYNLLSYLGGDQELTTRLAAVRKRPGIMVNFLGNMDQFENYRGKFDFATESTGWDEPTDNLRFNLLELHCYTINNSLQLGWRYSAHVHAEATIERLDQRLRAFLNELVDLKNL